MVALGCVRLGFWQLSRLAERRSRNAVLTGRLEASPVVPSELPRDSASRMFRHVRIAGRYDYAHEIVFVHRARDGVPGVHLATPVRPDSGAGIAADTVILVDRGFVYSPDAVTVDEAQWREGARVNGIGYVAPVGRGSAKGTAVVPGAGTAVRLRWLDRVAATQAVGAPVADFVIVLESDSNDAAVSPAGPAAPARKVPARGMPPALDEGPHFNYAVQWFAFALIAIVGSAWVVASRRESSRTESRK